MEVSFNFQTIIVCNLQREQFLHHIRQVQDFWKPSSWQWVVLKRKWNKTDVPFTKRYTCRQKIHYSFNGYHTRPALSADDTQLKAFETNSLFVSENRGILRGFHEFSPANIGVITVLVLCTYQVSRGHLQTYEEKGKRHLYTWIWRQKVQCFVREKCKEI